MASSTLSLGSGSYSLLDSLEVVGKVVQRGDNALVTSEGVITDLGIGSVSSVSSINSIVTVKAASIENFTADLGAGNDVLNIIGDVSNASILFGNLTSVGNNRLDIRGSLTSDSNVLSILDDPDSYYKAGSTEENIGRNQISGAAGKDTVSISGAVQDTNFYLAGGDDSLVIGGAAIDVYVNTGVGNDVVEFRGTTENIIVQTDLGNDTVIFRNELIGENNYDDVTASVELGAGNDSLTLANGASYAEINTGSGKDTMRLTGTFDTTEFYLGEGNGDSISISSNSKFYDSNFGSINTDGDKLIVGSASLWDNSDISFGLGNDSLVFGSNSTFTDSRISLGAGADTLVFGLSTTFDNITIDLGDDSDIDVLRFASDFQYDGVTFVGYDSNDIYYIGNTNTGYQFGAL